MRAILPLLSIVSFLALISCRKNDDFSSRIDPKSKPTNMNTRFYFPPKVKPSNNSITQPPAGQFPYQAT